MMLHRKSPSLPTLALLIALATVPAPLAVLLTLESVTAQTPTATPTSFPLPQQVPSGTTVRVDGSSSMTVINESLKQRFEERYPGTTVELASGGTDAAIQALLNGQIDLAAVGRPLTQAEKDQGLLETTLRREKIAIIVGPDNPFNGNLTFEQFARIFRGEITNWSELGGPNVPIRFVDRPETSDTRAAFRNYPVFQAAPFQTGATAAPVSEDDTAAVIQALGNDGIGYAIYEQVRDQSGVKIVPMHQTLPSDPRYPFSQSRGFVYRNNPASPVIAFLGFATSAPGQEAIAEATAAEGASVAIETSPGAAGSPAPGAAGSPAPGAAISPAPGAAVAPVPGAAVSPASQAPGAAAPETALVPSPGATTADDRGGFPWWILLPLALLGGGLFAWAKSRGGAAPAAAPPAPATPPTPAAVPPAPPAAAPVATPPAAAPVVPPAASPLSDRASSVISSDRAEIGGDRPAVAEPPGGVPIAAAGAAALGAVAGAAAIAGVAAKATPKSSINLAARDFDDAYAYWNAPEAHKAELRQQGGRDLKLRLYDVTGADAAAPLPQAFEQFDITDADRDRHLPVTAEHEYVSEVGYVTEDQRWLPLATSNRIQIPAAPATQTSLPLGGIAAGAAALTGAAALAGAAAVTAAKPTPKSRITLTARDSDDAFAYWEAPDAHKEELRQRGGRDLKLRLYDVTGTAPGELTSSFEEYNVAESDFDRHLSTAAERDYVAEIGYLTDDRTWLPLAQSNRIHSPAAPIVSGETDLPGAMDLSGVVPLAAGVAAAGVAATSAAITSATTPAAPVEAPIPDSHIVLVARSPETGYVYWETPEAHKASLRDQGGDQLALRIYDVTGLDATGTLPHTFQQYNVDETDPDRHVHISAGNRDYLAEIGYLTSSDRWLPLARSKPAYFPAAAEASPTGLPDLGSIAAGAAAIAAGTAGIVAANVPADQTDEQSTVEASKYNVGQTDLSAEELATVDVGLPELPDGYGESRIVLMPRDPQWAYTYWDVPNDHKEELRRQGGQRLSLRLYDVTAIDFDQQNSHSMQQYDCEEMARDWYVPIPVSDRDYVVEIGYLTSDGRWLVLARSAPAHIPPVFPSDWHDDQFLTLDWSEQLRGKTFANLVPPSLRGASMGNAIFDQIFGMAQSAEAMRVAGSLYGSMQMVPSQAISSYVFPSGVGMWELPTESGIGMSGVGFSASMPPIRPRKFWLVADAELIVYGATEPDATVTIGDRVIRLSPDGTFRFQMSFQDGLIDYPIEAVAADGEQNRAIHMKFTRETPHRNTNTKDEAVDEWFS